MIIEQLEKVLSETPKSPFYEELKKQNSLVRKIKVSEQRRFFRRWRFGDAAAEPALLGFLVFLVAMLRHCSS